MEFGIVIDSHKSKNVLDLLSIPFDIVITVCDSAAQECPSFPRINGRLPKIIHNEFDDPPRLVKALQENEISAVYTRVCKEIQTFVRDELPKIVAAAAPKV